jgi:pilus assembly protein CpaC
MTHVDNVKASARAVAASTVPPQGAAAIARSLLLGMALLPLPGWSQQQAAGAGPARLAPATGTAPAAASPAAPAPCASGPYEPIPKAQDVLPPTEIEMFVGESRVYPTPGVARIAVGNSQMMTAEVLDGKDTILFANAAGATSLFVWNDQGRFQRIKVNIVANDMARYARDVAAFLATIPNASASVVGDKVIVEGEDLSDADRDKITELAKRYPQIINFTSPVGWEQMVMMDVKVVEFPKSELRQLGLKWNAAGGAAIGGIWSPFRRGDAAGREISIAPPGNNTSPVPISGTPASSLATVSALNLGLTAQLNLLEQQGTATILAEPQLSTHSGYKASFLAGGEFPYSAATANGVTIQFKPYGIKLDIEPRVSSNGVIRAVVESEVTAIDGSVTSSIGPALTTRRTRAEFNVRPGETIVLAGLIQRSTNTDVDKVPLLGNIPVLGALFRSKRFQNKETELVVFVTPSIVDSRTPALADRVEKAQRRLGAHLGKPPHLSDPLRPGVDPARPQAPPPAASVPVASAPAPDAVSAPSASAPSPAADEPAATAALDPLQEAND